MKGLLKRATSFQLNELAQDWANQLMRKLVANGGNAILSHRPDNEWGENVAYTWTSRSVHELDAKEVTSPMTFIFLLFY